MAVTVRSQSRKDRFTQEPFVAFAFSDVFAGTVVPYDPVWESAPVGGKPVGCRIPQLACTRVGTANTPYVIANGAQLSGLDIIGSCITTANPTDQFHLTDFYFTPTFTTMPTTDRAMMFGKNLDFGGSLIEWGTIGGPAASVSSWQNCVDGGNYTIRYCALSRGVDGLHMNAVGNGKVYGCRISHGHYYSWWNTATGAPRSANFTDADGAPVALKGTSFEGGSAGTVTTTQPSHRRGGHCVQQVPAFVGTGTAAVITTDSMHGTKSMEASQSSTVSSTAYALYNGYTATSAACRFYFKISTVAPAANIIIMRSFDNTPARWLAVSVLTTGKLRLTLTSADTTTYTGAVTLSANTWYRVEWSATLGNASNAVVNFQYYLGDSS
jgi:hypothetical protein